MPASGRGNSLELGLEVSEARFHLDDSTSEQAAPAAIPSAARNDGPRVSPNGDRHRPAIPGNDGNESKQPHYATA